MAISKIGTDGIVQNANTILCQTSGNVGIGTGSPGYRLDVRSDDNYQMRAGNSGAYYDFGRNPSSGLFTFYGSQSGYTGYIFSGVDGERMRIDSGGNLFVGCSSNPNTSVSGVRISNPVTTQPSAFGAGSITTSTSLIYFVNGNGIVGQISVAGTATSFTTSSDYRLKENIQPMQNALGVVAQLNPVTYTWKADGSDGQGFIAHELQAVVPDCVTGEKDAVDEEGKPVYQGIDTSFLVATLTKAIQELNAKIEAQAAEITALKGAA